MKKGLLCLWWATIILNSFTSDGQASKSVQPLLNTAHSTEKIVALNLSGMLKGVSDLEVFDLIRDTFYLIHKDKFLQIDISTGRITTNEKINTFLSRQLTAKKYAKKLVASKNHFYISFFNELFVVSESGEATRIYNGRYAINDFNIGQSEILLASRDSLKMLDVKGKVLSSLYFDFTDAGFIKSAEGIFYSPTPDDDILHFYADQKSLNTKAYPPLSLNAKMKEPYVSYAAQNNFIAFDYWNRNALYIFSRGDKSPALIKTYSIKDLNYAPTQADLQKEEGQPNLKIAFDQGIYYAIVLSKGQLKIKPFTL